MSIILRPVVRLALPRAAARPAVLAARRSVMTITEAKYTAHASASGQGRDGTVKSDDDNGLELRLAMPQSLGGKGDGQNPEQLFAMGYAACFLNALQVVSRDSGNAAQKATVRTSVHIGTPKDGEGFGLAVDITVNGVEDQALVDAAHELCLYSRALKHGAVVNVSLGGEPNPGPANSRKDTSSSTSSRSSVSEPSHSTPSGTSTSTGTPGAGPSYTSGAGVSEQQTQER